MNKDKWNAIDPKDQKIIEEINLEWAPKHGQAWDASDMEGIRFFLQQGNEIIGLDAKESERWAKEVEPLISDYGKQLDGQGLNGKAVIQKIRDLLNKYEK
jgi:TRAP-type C4-dicarboxylate transport system substrate-binding protein